MSAAWTAAEQANLVRMHDKEFTDGAMARVLTRTYSDVRRMREKLGLFGHRTMRQSGQPRSRMTAAQRVDDLFCRRMDAAIACRRENVQRGVFKDTEPPRVVAVIRPMASSYYRSSAAMAIEG